MKAPDKIYIHPTLDNLYGMCERSCDNEIEYIRKDALVEKACEWLEPVLKNYAGYYVGEDILGDFKKYMED